MVAAVGVASMLIALSFAEVGSRFEGTGGPYLYTRAAFGRFAAFEVGWMLWFTRAASWAAVINVLATSLSYYWPPFSSGPARAIVITLITVAITAINLRGIRQSSIVVNVLTAAKLIPLVIFIGAGLFAMDVSRLAIDQPLTLGAAASSGLLLIFGFGGYEVVPVVAGETKDPRRAVPFALIVTIAVVTLIMTLTQVVAIGTLPNLATSSTPLASAAAIFLGAGGAALMTFGATMSASGNNMGQALSGTRNLYALAEHGDLPRDLRARAPPLPHAGHRRDRHGRRLPAAGVVRPLCRAGRGERHQPPDRLRLHLRGHDPAAPAAVRGGGQSGRRSRFRSVR